MNYDSKGDTLEHIHKVSGNIGNFCSTMLKRAAVHDNSKLEEPEKSIFDEFTPRLGSVEYGTKEYRDMLIEMKPAIKHHQKNNSHHPEYYENGIAGMDLFDIVELFCDWKAASERTKDGDLEKSITINANRFEICPQLVSIFNNTINKI